MKINVKFSEMNRDFKPRFSENDRTFKTKFDSSIKIIQQPIENYYDGKYEVIPKINSQVLPTAQKTMMKDVEIMAIPYFETSNTSGGNTVYIAKEV